jgi:ABC-2 type transport system ATP-binding protein
MNEGGATVFVSSHTLSEVQRHCRHVGVIREGRLIVSAPVEHFVKTQTRRVSVDGEAAVDDLEGARDVQRHNGHVSFIYQGEMQPLLKALHEGSVRDMTITELDLEDVFGQYYGGQP